MNPSKETYRKCSSCGTVHFSVSRAEAEENIRTFNQMYATLSAEERSTLYDGKQASLNDYLFCDNCQESAHKFESLNPEDFKRIKSKRLPTILFV